LTIIEWASPPLSIAINAKAYYFFFFASTYSTKSAQVKIKKKKWKACIIFNAVILLQHAGRISPTDN